MSCPHGNHPDNCDICDEVAAAYKSGVEHTKQSHEWVGLTEDERYAILHNYRTSRGIAQATESALKEKNQ